MIEPSLMRQFVRVEPVGSRVTCKPTPTNTDEDYLCLSYVGDGDILARILAKLGFDAESRAGYDSGQGELTPAMFRSWRRGSLNLIVTEDTLFYDKFMLATRVCRQLNLLEKPDRVMLFQAILYGQFAPPVGGEIDFEEGPICGDRSGSW